MMNFNLFSPALRPRFARAKNFFLVAFFFLFIGSLTGQVQNLPRIIVGAVSPAWSNGSAMNNVAVAVTLAGTQKLAITGLLTSSQITPLILPTSTSFINDYRNQNGVFYFEYPSVTSFPTNSTVQIKVSKNNDWLNGVATSDVLAIQKHLLGTVPFTKYYEKIAADIDLDGAITPTDKNNLQQIILATATATSLGLTSESWEFLCLKNLVNYGTPLSPGGAAFTALGLTVLNDPLSATFGTAVYPRSILTDGTTTMTPPLVSLFNNTPYWANFQGIKMGDVGGSKRATFLKNSSGIDRKSIATFTGGNSINENEVVNIKIRARNFQNLVGFQFPINFDVSSLKFLSIKSENLNSFDSRNMGLTDVNKGKMRFSWTSPSLIPENLSDNDVLLSISFLSKNRIENINEVIDFTQSDLPVEFLNPDIEFIDINLDIEVESRNDNIEISPNPFQDNLVINVNSEEEGDAIFSLTDLGGKNVFESNVLLVKGKQQLNFNGLNNLNDGLFIYSLNSEGKQLKGKVFKLK